MNKGCSESLMVWMGLVLETGAVIGWVFCEVYHEKKGYIWGLSTGARPGPPHAALWKKKEGSLETNPKSFTRAMESAAAP